VALRSVFIAAVAVLFLAVFSQGAEARQKYKVETMVSFGGVVMAGAVLAVWGISVAYSANAMEEHDYRLESDDESHALVQTKKEPDGIEIRLIAIKF